jgi:hypothetical protein
MHLALSRLSTKSGSIYLGSQKKSTSKEVKSEPPKYQKRSNESKTNGTVQAKMQKPA